MPRSTPSARTCGRRWASSSRWSTSPRRSTSSSRTRPTSSTRPIRPRPRRSARPRCSTRASARTDLLTQMAVTVQGYLALDLVKKNNVELVKGVDRASTTTVAALRTAVTVAQAMTNQKLVLEQITRAQHHHREHDRFHRRDAAHPDRRDPRAGGDLDDPARDAAARLPEHLRHDGPDRSVQAAGARQHEADRRHAWHRGREVEGLHRPRRRRESGQARGRVFRRLRRSRANESQRTRPHLRPRQRKLRARATDQSKGRSFNRPR